MSGPSQKKRPIPQRPGINEELGVKASWLIQTHSFFAAEDKVVRLYHTDERCRMSMLAFQRLFRSWFERDGKKNVYATSYWELDPKRLNIEGVRMRPDMPFPVFEENGAWFKNFYCEPVHTGDGDVQPFLDFMGRFLPVKTQREWLFDHMAHKQWKPEIPGQAVLFVADDDEGVREGTFGTGRGLLFKIAHKLYGENYAKAQSFKILDGSSPQSAYTDWMHNIVLVTVNEAKTSATAYRKGERNAVYEVLKEIVDPAPTKHNFTVKYGQAFNDYSYCTFWVATNHANAIAIPRWDRRFTVLTNGRKMTPEEAKAIVAWMEEPGNIAALSRWLAERDLSSFNMFEPLDTDAKAEMAELARTPVEDVLVELMEDNERGLVFVRPHFEQAVEDHLSGNRGWHVDEKGNGVDDGNRKHKLGGAWHGQLEGIWNNYIMPLKTKAGDRCRIRVGGRQTRLYCFRTRKQEAEKLGDGLRRQHAKRWGKIDPLKDELKVHSRVAKGAMNGIAEPTPEGKPEA